MAFDLIVHVYISYVSFCRRGKIHPACRAYFGRVSFPRLLTAEEESLKKKTEAGFACRVGWGNCVTIKTFLLCDKFFSAFSSRVFLTKQ